MATIKYNKTNIISTEQAPAGSVIKQLSFRILSTGLGSYSGLPQLLSTDTNRNENGLSISRYAVFSKPSTQFDIIDTAIEGIIGTPNNNSINVSFAHEDMRSYVPKGYPTLRRLDGASAALRGSIIAGMYAAASATPGGAYKLFNKNGNKYFGAGWGDHSNPNKIRNDFTLRSHVATRWKPGTSTEGKKEKGSWKPTLNPLELVTAFTGDRVSVIDFKQRKLPFAYSWNPVTELDNDAGDSFLANVVDTLGATVSQTQDFIKFYFTGPKLYAGNTTDEDDIIVFRAIIDTLTDTFQPNWTPQPMIGRADPNYQYTAFARDLNLSFTVYATSRDELKPIWRKLNALAGYTAPVYDESTIGLKGPWMRLTIGDLFREQPVIMTSLSYTLYDAESPWEINIEQDPTMMQVPLKIGVSCGFNMITDQIPQKGGKFYTLAKKFGEYGVPKRGNDNWLSDFGENIDIEKSKSALRKSIEEWNSNREKKPSTDRWRDKKAATDKVKT